MVVGAFPAAKLGALLLKQVSKPIANALKEQAKKSPTFRKYVCVPPAQFYNWCEVKTKMWILNLGKPVNIPVLNEAMAIDLGANLLGEGIIFIIAAGIVVSEYNRSSRKEAAKEQAKKDEMLQLQYSLQELYFTIEKQGTQIRELMRNISDLETRVVQKPWKPKRQIDEDNSSPPSPPVGPSIVQPIQNLLELEVDDCDDALDEEYAKPQRAVTLSEEINVKKGAKSVEGIQSSIVLVAVNDIENSFFKSDDSVREVSIISQAINHIFKDVYRLPLRL